MYSVAPFFISTFIQLKFHMLKMFAVSKGLSARSVSSWRRSSGENSGPRHSRANAERPSKATTALAPTTRRRALGEMARVVRDHTKTATVYTGQKRRRSEEEVRVR